MKSNVGTMIFLSALVFVVYSQDYKPPVGDEFHRRSLRSMVDDPLLDIHVQSQNGNVHQVQFLLEEAPADVNLINNQGSTPLDVALKAEQWSVVDLLLENGADPNLRNSDGDNALQIACRDPRNRGLVKNIFEWTKHPIDVDANTGRGTALSIAIKNADRRYPGTIKILVEEAGADVNAGNEGLWSPLSLARIQMGGWDLVEYLLAKGADPNQGCCGYPLLHCLCHHGKLDRVKKIFECSKTPVDVNRLDYGRTPLYYASLGFGKPRSEQKGKFLDIVKYLVEVQEADVNLCRDIDSSDDDDDNETPLYVALQEKNFEIAKYLVDNGAKVYEPGLPNPAERSPLSAFCSFQYNLEEWNEGSELFTLLFRNGMEAEVKASEGISDGRQGPTFSTLSEFIQRQAELNLPQVFHTIIGALPAQNQNHLKQFIQLIGEQTPQVIEKILEAELYTLVQLASDDTDNEPGSMEQLIKLLGQQKKPWNELW